MRTVSVNTKGRDRYDPPQNGGKLWMIIEYSMNIGKDGVLDSRVTCIYGDTIV